MSKHARTTPAQTHRKRGCPAASAASAAEIADDQQGDMITTKQTAIEWLFEELGSSTPRVEVHPSFITWAAGLCLGPIWGSMGGSESNLTDILAMTHRQSVRAQCGEKLVGFFRALTCEINQNPQRAVTRARMIELMVQALQRPGLSVVEMPSGKYLISTAPFERRYGIFVEVKLGGKTMRFTEW